MLDGAQQQRAILRIKSLQSKAESLEHPHDGPAFPEEAMLFRSKARELQCQYEITDAMLKGPEAERDPIWDRGPTVTYGTGWNFWVVPDERAWIEALTRAFSRYSRARVVRYP